VVIHAPPQGVEASALPNFGSSFSLCIHPLTQNYKKIIRGVTCFKRSATSTFQGDRVPAVPNFRDSFVYLCAHLWSQLPNLTWWRMSGRGVYLGISHASHPNRAEFQHSPILGFSCSCAFILWRRTTKSRHGNTQAYARGVLLGG